jgi:hypothetical protein
MIASAGVEGDMAIGTNSSKEEANSSNLPYLVFKIGAPVINAEDRFRC